MKKYIILLITVVLTSVISCNVEDNLVIPQQGVIAVESTYENANDQTVLSFIAGIYSRVYGSPLDGFASYNDVTGVVSMKHYLERMSGELANGWLYNESAESAKPFRVFWAYSYSIMYSCNLVIEELPLNKVASREVVDRVIAEARVVRAIQMMQLVQLYGNPPLADHILKGTEGNTPATESWAFIEKELNEAALGLPSKNGPNGQASIGGRLTKEAAYAYLGKAYLWQKKYTEAASTLYNKVIATNLYSLVDNYNKLNSTTTDFCPENMWEFEVTENPDYNTSQSATLAAAFINWDVAKMNMPDGYYKNQGYGEYSGISESFGSFMDAHDVASGTKSNRYKGTLATYEDMFEPTRFAYTGTGGKKGMKDVQTRLEGYFRVKGIPQEDNVFLSGGFWYSDLIVKNWVFMRYSEILLNYAEAVASGGTPGAMTGLQALNLVRQRAGLANAPSLDMNNAEYGVKAERRAELFYENCRFIDLVRWGDAATVLANVGKKMPKFYGYKDGSTSGPQSKANWKIEYDPTIGVGFKANKNELFPIPLIEMNNNSNLVQNPGW